LGLFFQILVVLRSFPLKFDSKQLFYLYVF
jgi:hypothetical protein